MIDAAVFTIALMFTDWDECWDFYHRNKEVLQQVELAQFCVDKPRVSYAPQKSLRPKLRPDTWSEEN